MPTENSQVTPEEKKPDWKSKLPEHFRRQLGKPDTVQLSVAVTETEPSLPFNPEYSQAIWQAVDALYAQTDALMQPILRAVGKLVPEAVQQWHSVRDNLDKVAGLDREALQDYHLFLFANRALGAIDILRVKLPWLSFSKSANENLNDLSRLIRQMGSTTLQMDGGEKSLVSRVLGPKDARGGGGEVVKMRDSGTLLEGENLHEFDGVSEADLIIWCDLHLPIRHPFLELLNHQPRLRWIQKAILLLMQGGKVLGQDLSLQERLAAIKDADFSPEMRRWAIEGRGAQHNSGFFKLKTYLADYAAANRGSSSQLTVLMDLGDRNRGDIVDTALVTQEMIAMRNMVKSADAQKDVRFSLAPGNHESDAQVFDMEKGRHEAFGKPFWRRRICGSEVVQVCDEYWRPFWVQKYTKWFRLGLVPQEFMQQIQDLVTEQKKMLTDTFSSEEPVLVNCHDAKLFYRMLADMGVALSDTYITDIFCGHYHTPEEKQVGVNKHGEPIMLRQGAPVHRGGFGESEGSMVGYKVKLKKGEKPEVKKIEI